MSDAPLKRITAIAGPTASGKSSLSIVLAKKLDAEIISMDSMQVYRGLDIGTAKPTIEERESVPHHLLDVVEPDEDFTAADFVRFADEAIENALSRGKRVILCGGTGFYLKALLYGLYDSPPADDKIRIKFRERADNGEDLYRELKMIDPATAEGIHHNDIYRIIRALEVHAITGRPLSEFKDAHSAKPRYESVVIAIDMDRNSLYSRIEKRADMMFKSGIVDEVKTMKEKGYTRDLRPFTNMGYKYVWAYIEGEMGISEAMELLIRDTRRYAKRQLTWFKNQRQIHWVESDKSGMNSEQLARVEKLILYT